MGEKTDNLINNIEGAIEALFKEEDSNLILLFEEAQSERNDIFKESSEQLPLPYSIIDARGRNNIETQNNARELNIGPGDFLKLMFEIKQDERMTDEFFNRRNRLPGIPLDRNNPRLFPPGGRGRG